MDSLRGIVFDLDGTLLDSAEIKCKAFGQLFRQYGPDVEKEVVEDHLISEGVSRFVKFKRWYQNILCLDYSDDIGIELSRQFSEILSSQIASAPWMPGALEFLQEWHTKIPLYLASATPHAELQQLLQKRSMCDFFGSAWGFPTSKTVALQHVIAELHAAPKTILMVGDAEADYHASLAAGVSFCRFKHLSSGWPLQPELHPVLSRIDQLATIYSLEPSL
jgi:HAD superfamily hydrolase (TIGR01549 family)